MDASQDRYGPAARRGSYFEKAVARSLETWISKRPDRNSIHLFNDLDEFQSVPGIGTLPPLDVGPRNIDHVVLTGDRWLIIESKGIGAGTLRMAGTDVYLMQADGTLILQPWANSLEMWPMAGIMHRLTNGMRGQTVWIIPSSVTLHENLTGARFLSRGGYIATVREIYQSHLNEALPPGRPPADPQLVEKLSRYVS